LTSLIATLRNSRPLTNRGTIDSEMELVISSLKDSNLTDQSSGIELVRKIISDSYKYEFLRPRETGQSISFTTHQDYFTSNLHPSFKYDIYDRRVGIGFRYDKKEYINQKLQWNTLVNIDFSNNTLYSTELALRAQEYFSAHATVSTRLDVYTNARSRFGYQLSLEYDYYESIPSLLRPSQEFYTAKFDFDYEYQLSRKSSITLNTYLQYNKLEGLGLGMGVKLRF